VSETESSPSFTLVPKVHHLLVPKVLKQFGDAVNWFDEVDRLHLSNEFDSMSNLTNARPTNWK